MRPYSKLLTVMTSCENPFSWLYKPLVSNKASHSCICYSIAVSQSRGHVIQVCSAPTDPSSLSCAMKDPSVESVMKVKWQQTTPTKKIEEIQLVNLSSVQQLNSPLGLNHNFLTMLWGCQVTIVSVGTVDGAKWKSSVDQIVQPSQAAYFRGCGLLPLGHAERCQSFIWKVANIFNHNISNKHFSWSIKRPWTHDLVSISFSSDRH